MNGWEIVSVVLIAIGLPFTAWMVLGFPGAKRGAPTIPNPPPSPPELSCFVRGLIRSMRETPGEWKETGSGSNWWRHSNGITVVGYSGHVFDAGYTQAPGEPTALSRAVNAYLGSPSLEPLRAHFEKLGCPDAPSSSPSAQ